MNQKSATMKSKMSAGKRLSKPILFGSVLVGLATLFCNRHRFLEDVMEFRAQEEVRHEAKRMEFLEMLQRQKEEAAEKKKQRQAKSD